MTDPAAALTWHHAGCSVIPLKHDGTKEPKGAWKAAQTVRATPASITSWYTKDPALGIGVVCGAVSGGLEMFEAEGRAVTEGLVQRLAQACEDNGIGDIWATIGAYVEVTPSGGLHWYYRVDGPPRGNLKLARRPSTEPNKVDVLLETRGEAGYSVVAPSNGTVHDTGRPWQAINGTPTDIPTITADQRDALHAVAAMFDEMPAKAPYVPLEPGTDVGERPGDDYNTRATWDDLLTPRGWTRIHPLGNGWAWRRPGKNNGISATTGTREGDRLYVFTTSTEFEECQPYAKFAAYALLEHGGDYSSAARALRAAGYGAPLPPSDPGLASLIVPVTTSAQTSPALHSLTDDGNALRLIDTYGDVLRYVPQRGAWISWDGHRWRWDEAEHVREHARDTARSLSIDTKAEEAHKRRSLSAGAISGMVRLAQTDRRIIAHVGQLDARPYELNTPAGVIDLRTGKLMPPDPAALHTRCTNLAPDFDNNPERWLRFLATTFAGDAALTTFVQRMLGVSLIGTVLEQVLPFGFGSGANGKTTLIGTVQRVVGIGDDGYSISAPAELLLATATQGHPTEIARLAGARLVVTSELEDGQHFAEAKVKQLTGRDTISGRFMRQDWFSFTPTHTLWLLANHQPAVRAGGPAFWRRIRMLPFMHTVPDHARDPHLEDTLVDTEGSQILAWIAQGAADYLTHGLGDSASVRVATETYAADQDTVGRFVSERCAVGPPGQQGMTVRVATLRAAYETWCRVEGEEPVAPKTLTLTLRSAFGVLSDRDRSSRFYTGLRLDDASPDASPEDSSEDSWWQK